MKRLFTLSLLSLTSIASFAQVKKVILEDFTGTWCGWCPEGTVIIENLHAANKANFIPVASHNGDALEIPDGAAIDNGLNVTGYPNGAIDRFQFTGTPKIPQSRGSWQNSVNTRLATTAIASVSFTNMTKTGSTYKAKINVKFTAAPVAGVPIKVNVYITEDSIAATGANEQDNYSTQVQGGASPLTNWWHNATLRMAVGGAWGFADVIPATAVVGTTYSKDITFDIPAGWVAKNINVIGFVAYDGAAADNKKEILNADQIMLKNWGTTGIKEQANAQMQAAIYPNPATLNSVIKTSFVLKDDATVTMKVINALGQVVSKPYVSYEIAGAHTIQWSPVENGNITPGIYFIQLTTDKGDTQTSRIILQ